MFGFGGGSTRGVPLRGSHCQAASSEVTPTKQREEVSVGHRDTSKVGVDCPRLKRTQKMGAWRFTIYVQH